MCVCVESDCEEKMVKTKPLEAVCKMRKAGGGKTGDGGGRGGGGLLASAIAVALGGEIDASGERSAALATDLGASADSIERELANSIRKARERRSHRLGKSRWTRRGITTMATPTTTTAATMIMTKKDEQKADCSRSYGINDIDDDGIAVVGTLAVNVSEKDANAMGTDEMETDAQPPSRHSTRGGGGGGGTDRLGCSGQLPSPSSSATSSFLRCSGNVVVFDESGRAVESVDYFSAQNLVEEDCAL